MSKNQTNVVEINVNNHLYKIACEEGQENHIQNLAKIINDEVQKLVASLGQIGETRLLLMTCLIIADKLKENNTRPVVVSDGIVSSGCSVGEDPR